MKIVSLSSFFAIIILLIVSCNQGRKQESETQANDTTTLVNSDSVQVAQPVQTNSASTEKNKKAEIANVEKAILPQVLIYNFHVTNRCVSCIAIEDATTKALNVYFANELKQGRIKRQIVNVDDDANKALSEKYEAFGSGVFITRSFNGKESTTDLTGDGFKYAKNKEEKFIEILKNTITEYLK